MPPLFLPLLSVARAQGAPLVEDDDLFARPVPVVWYGELKSVSEGVSAVLLPTLSMRAERAQDLAASEEREEEKERARLELDLERSRVRRQLLDQKIIVLDREIEDLEEQRQFLESQHALAVAGLPELDQKVEERSAALSAAMATLGASLARDPMGQRRVNDPLQRWIVTRAQMDWDQAFASEASLSLLHDQERALEAAGNGCSDGVREALYGVLIAARHEEDTRRERHEQRLALAEPPAADVERRINDARMQRQDAARISVDLGLHVRSLEGALSAQRADAAETDEVRQREARLRKLDALSSKLRLQVDELPSTVPADAWCKLHIDSAVIRLALNQDPAEPLRVAAAANQDACNVAAADWLAWGPFQVAWTEARFALTGLDEVRLVLNVSGGRWSVDGTPVYGLGSTNLRLKPGVHRIERQTPDGELIWHVEELHPGERLAVWAEGDKVKIEDAPSAVVEPPIRLPPITRSPDVEFVSAAPAEPSRLSLSITGSYLSWHKMPAMGVSIGGSMVLARRDACLISAGLAHDQTWTEHSVHLVGSLSWPVIPRERAVLSVLGRPEARVHPLAEASFGLLLLQAPMAELGVGAELGLTDALHLRVTGAAGTSFWSEGISGLDTTFGLGLAAWL